MHAYLNDATLQGRSHIRNDRENSRQCREKYRQSQRKRASLIKLFNKNNKSSNKT